MKLTGKCKTDFDKWRLEIHKKEWVDKPKSKEGFEFYGYSAFYELPLSCQFGVYVDFFDSVGIDIIIGRAQLKPSKNTHSQST